jgi:hypothetical protein
MIDASVSKLSPCLNIEESHLFFQVGILSVKTVGSDGEIANGCTFLGGAKQRVTDHVAFDKDTVEIVHICLRILLRSGG